MKTPCPPATAARLALVSAIFALALSPARAALISDDFQDYTVDEEPGGNWIISENGTIAVQADTGDQFARLTRDDTTVAQQPYMDHFFTAQDGFLETQFDFRYNDDSLTNPTFRMLGTGGTGPLIHLKGINNNNQVHFNDGSGFASISGMDHEKDTWYRFTITIADITARTFDLRIQDRDDPSGLDVTVSDLGFQSSSVSDLDRVRFNFNIAANSTAGQNQHYDINNVTVIPEPASILMVTLAGLLFGLTGRRRLRSRN